MKARVKMPLSLEIQRVAEQIRAEIEETTKADQNRAITRAVKIACLILHNEYGFGNYRLGKFLDSLRSYCNQVAATPEQWYYIDEQLEKLGLIFEKEDIAEREEHSREVYHAEGRKFREYGGKI